MTDHIETMKDLQTTLIDSKNGYQEALEDAQGRGLTPLFRELIALRELHIGELGGVLAGLGEKPNDDGSFMTTVNRTIISIRSFFGELDERILPGLIDGEKRILSYYDSALETAASTPDREMLTRQRMIVAKTIADMERRNNMAA